jgi:hypothetical protein
MITTQYGQIWRCKDTKNLHYVRIRDIAYDYAYQYVTIIIFNKCDENGVFISIRDGENNEYVIPQPFFAKESKFLELYERYDAA